VLYFDLDDYSLSKAALNIMVSIVFVHSFLHVNIFCLSYQVNPRDNRLLFEVFDENRVVSCLISHACINCNCKAQLSSYQYSTTLREANITHL